MQQLAFASPGNFFRGNLHTHSTRSDGGLEPAEVCRRYAAEGYDFLCLSDHFLGTFDYPITDTRDFRTNRFTTLAGAEIHSGALGNGELWHILAVGLPADFAPPEAPGFRAVAGQESGADLAARARAAGAFVAIAHPQWYGLTLADARAIEAAHAVEIYNHGCQVECDRGDGTAILDLLLADGRRLSGCASDDAHFRGLDPDHFGGWVMVKAEANEPEALLEALKAGAYYSSQGPELREVAVEGDSIRVASSPVAHLMAVGQHSASRVVHGRALTVAELPLAPFRAGGWFRVVAMDSVGRRAWSNPVWLD
ncbi:CehA/McbA family metallohydrolase [Paralimibaculum aggregatum]|uniref:CehA/McbA family metallohydrolase n=1 Tax=Paralimibaculum aggregatum TaxID=3036245 RepID=A0ABQ6LMS4_9RHOB|nr:CehA/McbA family metallohydrolase [Limibaculum sp. NKW23]GMG83600.1 CehA/McbA family metallohydrolase [Limibaculum sp. NKW23]